MKKYDVIVVGGGLSGAAAAISAARHGANVLLVEKSNCLSGAAANNLVFPFMTYWTIKDENKFYLSRGIFTEIRENLSALCDKKTKNDVCFSTEDLKLVLNRMAIDSGVELLFDAYFSDAAREGDQIKSVECSTVGGKLTFWADYFIDATGDAALAFLSGAATRLGRDADQLCQPMTLCFRMSNVDTQKYRENSDEINTLYKKFQSEGKIKNPRENILTFIGVAEGVLHLNTTRVCRYNPTDPFEKTKAEIEAREQAYETYRFLKENSEACQNAELLCTAAEIGVRESRMIDGEYLLTGDDLRSCTKFADAIAAGNYDIDIHNPEGSGTSHYYFNPGEYYTIPYRALVPKKISNLLVTGRCGSFDHEAQASVRIMPICTTLGQAAGTAISLAVKNKCAASQINIDELQAILKEDGAFF